MIKNYVGVIHVEDGGVVNFNDGQKENNLKILHVDGNDITTFLKIINICFSHKYSPKVEVSGTSNVTGNEVTETVYSQKSESDVYVRGVSSVTASKEILTIGGGNATKQNIAAKKFVIFIPNDIYLDIVIKNTWIGLYDTQVDHSNVYAFLKKYPVVNNSIDDFTSLLKNYPSTSLLKKIIDELFRNFVYSDEVMSGIVEAFRTLGTVCLTNPDSETLIVNALEEFSYRAFKQKYYKSTIFSIEAIGAIYSGNKKTEVVINNLLTFFIKNLHEWENEKHREHLIWCSLSMLKTSNIKINSDYSNFVSSESFRYIPDSLLLFHEIK